jgi:cell wall-associated NlpC family hydrolase
MPTQTLSARAQRASVAGRWILAGTASLTGALAGSSPAEAARSQTHVLTRNLGAFERALGLVELVPGLPESSRGPSRVERMLRAMVRAGDQIARLPYIYGGGHGSFTAPGYDCSGSVSYVLHAAGLLATPADSSGLESYGDAGPGRHVTIYANGGHALITIDGRRFDTIAFQETGTRWSPTVGDTSGYVVRHPRGL